MSEAVIKLSQPGSRFWQAGKDSAVVSMSITFEVIQELEGSFVAACYSENIFLDGKNLQELHDNISAALDRKFEGRHKPSPGNVRLMMFRE
ncbi:MAG: hypothetical protein ACFB20_10025 [Opitutales bacterium]